MRITVITIFPLLKYAASFQSFFIIRFIKIAKYIVDPINTIHPKIKRSIFKTTNY